MEYFVMKTDERLRRLPQIEVPGGFSGEKQKSVSILYVKEQHGLRTDYADYLDAQLPLISEKFQRILEKYQQDVRLQRVMLIERGTGRQVPYCLVGAPEIVCIDQTETGDGVEGIKTLVIEKEEIGDRRIFFARSESGGQLLVGLDIAESLLRREANGIRFAPVRLLEGGRQYGG